MVEESSDEGVTLMSSGSMKFPAVTRGNSVLLLPPLASGAPVVTMGSSVDTLRPFVLGLNVVVLTSSLIGRRVDTRPPRCLGLTVGLRVGLRVVLRVVVRSSSSSSSCGKSPSRLFSESDEKLFTLLFFLPPVPMSFTLFLFFFRLHMFLCASCRSLFTRGLRVESEKGPSPGG